MPTYTRVTELTTIGRTVDEETCRTRLEACRIENREFELAEGFKDLGHDHSGSTKNWDWVCLFACKKNPLID